MKTVTLTEGVTLRTQELEKFKTTLVTFNIYTREEESEAGISAFLSGLLSCGYPEYRTLSELNKNLIHSTALRSSAPLQNAVI